MGTPKYDSISLKIFTIRDIDEANSRTHHQFLGPFGENFRKYYSCQINATKVLNKLGETFHGTIR
jgi:hypothetical protein